MINSGSHAGINLGSHLGGHLRFGILQAWSNVFIVRNEIVAPKYPTLDTKIIVLGGIVTEIGNALDFNIHLGSHLGFWTKRSIWITCFTGKSKLAHPKTPACNFVMFCQKCTILKGGSHANLTIFVKIGYYVSKSYYIKSSRSIQGQHP